jgi:TRAP-type C4-dicarboxylate transport system permease small subunit
VIVRRLRLCLEYASAAILAGMAALTVVDVLSRDLFGWPVPGGYELTELLLMSLFFLALPATGLAGEHITVTLVDKLVGLRWGGRMTAFAEAAIAVVLGAIAWRIWILAESTARYGDVTLYLEIPAAPFAFLAAAMTVLSAAVFLARSVESAVGGRGRGEGPDERC